MADDWKVGDLALCVNDRGYSRPHLLNCKNVFGLSLGRHYMVSGVIGVSTGPYGPCTLLALDGVNFSIAYDGGVGDWRFIKITPEEADDFDRETIELMNRKTVGETVA